MIHEPNSKSSIARRDFISSTSTLLATAGLSALAWQAKGNESDTNHSKNLIAPNDVILFQGDSITDAGWNRDKGKEPNNQAGLGSGYAWLAAASILTDRPKDGLKAFNRGISGHKVFQLAERWDRDCLNLKPNVLSILIGVNDIWHTLNGKYNGTVEIYEKDYMALIERSKKSLPQVKLIICEPFVLRCGAVNEKWFPEFDEYRSAAKRVAKAFNTTFVAFQSMFDTAIQLTPPEHSAGDGVHPSSAGAALMAHTWLDTVRRTH